MAVPPRVLQKPGPLTAAEWRQVQAHAEIGARLIRAAGLDEVAPWVLAHHERIDGGGYPHGLRGDEIPLEARILTVADAFDAMRTNRPYRGAFSEREAIEELRRAAGTQFDRRVVETFVAEPVPA